jgi:RNA polymerase sigma-70 factor (ECF subfamily)
MADPASQAAQRLAAARAGSSEALGQLLEGCRGYLLLVAERELDPDLRAKGGASDLVQEALVDAVRDFARFEGDTEAALLAWLRRLLLHNLTDFTRLYRDTDKRQVGREVPLAAGDSSERRGPTPGADILSPSGQAMQHEQAAALERALDRLPEDYRRVLTLRYLEGRSFAEIGRLMQRSANAARKLWTRAVEHLQQELEPPS